MSHLISADDLEFQKAFELCEYSPAGFDHRAHLRLAYVYLAQHGTEDACQSMRDSLIGFLEHHGIDRSKYHDTMTRAWVLAVRHFMANTAHSESTDSFIEQNPVMLDTKIMLTHYSAEVLFSDEARAGFVDPDLAPIPRY